MKYVASALMVLSLTLGVAAINTISENSFDQYFWALGCFEIAAGFGWAALIFHRVGR